MKQGEYISGEELAVVIEANPGRSLPNDIRDYLCRFLRGQVKRKRGPQKKPLSYSAIVTDIFLPILYQEELHRIQKARKARGRGGKGEMAPHEQATLYIKERFKQFAMITPRRIANILSSRGLGRLFRE